MTTTPLTGGCLCGGVRYSLTAAPTTAAYCHCTRCRRRTGTAASANARVDPDTVRIERGAELVRSWIPDDGGWAKDFCSVCGSALWSRSPADGAVRGIRMGTFDRDPGVTFTHRQFTDVAATWEPIPDDGLPRFGGPPPE